MKTCRGYIMNTPKTTLFFETDARRTDKTARAALEIIGKIYNSNPDTLERAKNDRGTLDDVKKRLEPYELQDDGTRQTFTSGGSCFSIPVGAPGYIILTKEEAAKRIATA